MTKLQKIEKALKEAINKNNRTIDTDGDFLGYDICVALTDQNDGLRKALRIVRKEMK